MPCFHPITAYKCANGEVVFSELRRYDTTETLSLPCGRCVGCRLERSRQWAMRCLHEASLYDRNCFVTLTFDDDHYPVRGDLEYSQFQRFMRRLRKHFAGQVIRFYMCGEYGSLTWRPHFHACLFNCDFEDKELWSTRDSVRLFTSPTLSRLWPFGFSTIGDLTFETAAYTARYCMKKVNGDLAEVHYARSDQAGPYLLTPEFCHMSLKPGIGARWADRFASDVFPHDYVVINGQQTKPPRYYDRRRRSTHPEEMESIEFARQVRGRGRYLSDGTDERLRVREAVATARAQLLPRKEI